MSGHWIDESPRGEKMPIDLEYPFSFGRPIWYLEDIPPGYDVALRPTGHTDVLAFPTSQEVRPGPDGLPLVFAYLVDADGVFVATWDEGRWWTPDESAAWLLMLAAPATYAMAEGMRQQGMPRWWRRAQRRKRRD